MKIAVLVKQVPDSWAEKKMGSDGRIDRAGVDAVLNDLDEYAIEEALRLVEKSSPTGSAGEGSGHTVTVISMGPERATDAIRKALSMGADNAILITDEALAGSDALATSKVLTAEIVNGGYDLVLCGTESTDARMAVVPAMIAERLDWPQLTFASEVFIQDTSAHIVRTTEFGIERMSAELPAVIAVVEKINEPRYPSFKGIMAAKKKEILSKSLSDLGLSHDEVGSKAAWTSVLESTPKPAKAAGIKIDDDGSGGEKLVAYLRESRLI